MEIPEKIINEIIDNINDLIEIIDSEEQWEMCPIVYKIKKELMKFSEREQRIEQRTEIEMKNLIYLYNKAFNVQKESITLKQLPV